jgi:hypothetical protein
MVESTGGGVLRAFGTGHDVVGIVLWVVGWSVEAIADVQKVNSGFERANDILTNKRTTTYAKPTVEVEAGKSAKRPTDEFWTLEVLEVCLIS